MPSLEIPSPAPYTTEHLEKMLEDVAVGDPYRFMYGVAAPLTPDEPIIAAALVRNDGFRKNITTMEITPWGNIHPIWRVSSFLGEIAFEESHVALFGSGVTPALAELILGWKLNMRFLEGGRHEKIYDRTTRVVSQLALQQV